MRHKVKKLPGKGFIKETTVLEVSILMELVKDIVAQQYVPQTVLVHPDTYAKLKAHYY